MESTLQNLSRPACVFFKIIQASLLLLPVAVAAGLRSNVGSAAAASGRVQQSCLEPEFVVLFDGGLDAAMESCRAIEK